MKRTIILFFCLLNMVAYSQSVKDLWKPILNHSELATYFSGMWEKLGISVDTYNEKITVINKGDHFELKEGADPKEVDYLLELKANNIQDMAEFGADGKVDTYESYRIMGTLFTPFVRATLSHPMMNKAFQMKLAKIENHIHVYLESTTNDDVKTHTLLFVNKQWIVAEGIQGKALREFHLSPEQAVRYQREAFKAQKENTRKSWKTFKKFYLEWRKEVSDGSLFFRLLVSLLQLNYSTLPSKP